MDLDSTPAPAADPSPAPVADTPASSAPEPSGPLSTHDIAARALESLEGDGDESNTPAPSPDLTPAPAPEPPKALTPEEQEIEALLADFGFKDAKKPDGREHYIPRSKVLKMIGSGLKRGQERWTTERQTLERQVQDVAGHLTELRNGVMGDPRRFIAELATINPRYGAFLHAPEPQAPEDREPAPDLDLGDGRATYSTQGLQQLLDWKVQQALKPIQAERQQREQQQAEQLLEAQTQSVMAEAEKWPDFGAMAPDGRLNPFQGQVLQALQQIPPHIPAKAALRMAYLEVRQQKLEGDSRAARERALSDLSTAAPALARTPSDARVPPQARSTAEAARRALDRLERGV